MHLPVLLAGLKDRDAAVRAAAVDALGNLGPEADGAVAELSPLLKDSSGLVRVRAAQVLWNLDPEQRQRFVSVFVECLRDPDEAVCQAAMAAINQFAYQHASELRPALAEFLAIIKNRKRHRSQTIRLAVWSLLQFRAEPRQAVPLLLELLADADADMAEAAAQYLPNMASTDPAVRKALLAALKHPASKVRVGVAGALGGLVRLGGPGEECIAALTEALGDPDNPEVRAAAANALGQVGPRARPAVPALVRALDDKSDAVRLAAARALSQLDPEAARPAIPTLVRLVGMREPQHYGAHEVLQKLGPDGINGLIQALQDRDKQLRRAAAYGLGDLRVRGRAAVPALKAALRDDDPLVRALAGAALMRHDPRAEGARDAWLAGFDSTDLYVREQALQTAMHLGPRAKDAVPALARLAADADDWKMQSNALSTLASIGAGAKGALPALARLLKEGRPEVRDLAAHALGRIGTRDPALIPVLIDDVRARGHYPSHNGMEALRRYGPEVVPHWLKALKDQDPDFRAVAISHLAHWPGADGDDVQAALTQALRDESPHVRLAAGAALLSRDRESAEMLATVMPLIKAGLKDTAAGVRARAVQILQQIAIRREGGAPPAEVADLLLAAAKDKDRSVRAQALQVFTRIHLPPKEAFPVLLAALKDKDPNVRRTAMMGMHHFGPLTKEAVQALRDTLPGADEHVQAEIVYALAKAGMDDKTLVPILVQLLKTSPHSYVRATAVNLIAGRGAAAREAMPLIEDALQDEDMNLRQAAAYAMTQLDPASKRLPSALADTLGQVYRNRHPIRYAQRTDKKPLGTDAAKVLMDILTSDGSPERRVGAIAGLALLVQEPERASKVLRGALNDDDARVRLYAAEALWLIHRDAGLVVPILIDGLKEKDSAQQALMLVQELGPAAKDAVPALIDLVRGPDENLAAQAASSLGRIGPEAKAAIPALIEILKEGGTDNLQWSAVHALGVFRRDAKDAVPHLLQLVQTTNEHARGSLLSTLSQIATAEEAMPTLIELLADPDADDPHQRLPHELNMAFRSYGDKAAGPVGKLLKHKEAAVRRRAAAVLHTLGPQAARALPDLLTALDDKDDEVAVPAAETIWHINRSRQVLATLTRGLTARSSLLRQRAAHALGLMGAEAKEAVPDLLAASRDPDRNVRRAVVQALRRIDPKAAKEAGDPEKDPG